MARSTSATPSLARRKARCSRTQVRPRAAISIAITGSGFTDATAVSFGDVPATSFTVEADDLIEAVAPPGAGTVPVSVTADGSSQVVDDYTYVAITSISPQGGPTVGGTAVDIFGTGLESAERVLFGETAVEFTQVSEDEIEAVSPPGSGTQDITVVTPFGGTTPLTPADQFTYGASMSTTGRAKSTTSTPSSGQGVSTHRLGAPAPTTRSQPAKPLTAPLPAWRKIAKWVLGQYTRDLDWIGKYHIQALADAAVAYKNPTCQTTHAVLEDYTQGAVELAFLPAAAVLKLGAAVKAVSFWASAPISGRLVRQVTTFASQWAIDDTLKQFSKATVDGYFGACPGEKLAGNMLVDPSGAVLDTNGNPVSGATVTITRSDSAAGPFAPVEPSSPGITPAVNPETTGEDGVFHWDVSSGFYELEASNVGCTDPNNAGSSTATIGPYPVPPPQVGLVITLACPSEPAPPTPSVTSLSLAGGASEGGTQVTILGTGFTPSSSVTFGGAVASATYLSSEALAVVSPPGAGLVDVVVHNSGKESATSDADQFFYGAPPTVTGLSVNHGSASGGTSVTISGSGFTSATVVGFGGLPAASFSVVSDSEITAVAPAAPAGVSDVQVITPAGGSATTSSDQFTFDPVTQTLTFTSTPPASPAVGGTYAVSATASSGLPVFFSIDPASTSGCSIQGSTVSFSPPAGTCVIDADQPGDGSFSSAPRQQQVVTVTETLTPPFSSSGGPNAGAGPGAGQHGVLAYQAPTLSNLTLQPSAFSTRAHKHSHPGTTISYHDSQAATTTITIQRQLPGVLKGHTCLTPPKHPHGSPHHCTRYATAGSVTHNDIAGTNTIRFDGRLNGHVLPAGTYRLLLAARNTAGQTSQQLITTLKIIP